MEKESRKIVFTEIALGTIVLAATTLAMVFEPERIRFRAMTAGEFLELMAPLFLVALIIERTLEVFLTAWRAEKADELEFSARDKSAEGQRALIAYKGVTRRIAFLCGFTLGAVAAAVGMRILEMLVDPAAFTTLGTSQKCLFRGLDIVLSGALLGGGSDGLHKLISVFTDFLDKTRGRIPQTSTAATARSSKRK